MGELSGGTTRQLGPAQGVNDSGQQHRVRARVVKITSSVTRAQIGNDSGSVLSAVVGAPIVKTKLVTLVSYKAKA